MPRCGCNDSCGCRFTQGSGTTVSGDGSDQAPYRVDSSVDPAKLISELNRPADGSTDTLVVDRPARWAENLPLRMIGPSYGAQTGNAAVIYFDRLRRRLNSIWWYNRSVSGWLAEDLCSFAYGTATALCQGAAAYSDLATVQSGLLFPAPFKGGFDLLDVARNSAGYDGNTSQGGTTAKSRAGFINALDATIRLARAAYFFPNSVQHPGSTTTAGSSVVGDLNITAIQLGQSVTGANIPANSYIGTVTPGVGFRLSSSPTNPTAYVNATATGTTTLRLSPAYSSGWSVNQTQQWCSGGVVGYTSTPNATVTYTWYQPYVGRASWQTLAIDDDALGISGATYSVTVDGGTPITGTTSRQCRKTNGGGGPKNGFVQKSIPLGVLAVGYHTMVAKHTGAAGSYLYDDSVLLEASQWPTTLAYKLPPLPAGGYATYGAGASWATDQVYNTLIDTVAARFGTDKSVAIVDPGTYPTWNPETMIGNYDGYHVHLNDLGNGHYADAGMHVINTLPPRAGAVRL